MLRGGLFSRYFLETGIRTTSAWNAVTDEDVENFAQATRPLINEFQSANAPSEAETETRLIFPVLALLGWHHLPQQQASTRRENIPDALLFLDASGPASAMGKPVGRGGSGNSDSPIGGFPA